MSIVTQGFSTDLIVTQGFGAGITSVIPSINYRVNKARTQVFDDKKAYSVAGILVLDTDVNNAVTSGIEDFDGSFILGASHRGI